MRNSTMPIRWLLRRIFRRNSPVKYTKVGRAHTSSTATSRSQQLATISECAHFIEKRVLLYDERKRKFSEIIFKFHRLNGRVDIIGANGSDHSELSERNHFVYCKTIRTNNGANYEPEKSDPVESEFLQDIVALLEKINQEIRECYQQEERRLILHLRETRLDIIFNIWGVAKWCLQLIGRIYTIVAPLIIQSKILRKKLKSTPGFKNLAAPVSLFCSTSTCQNELIRAPDLKSACYSYLKRIEQDVRNLYNVLEEIKPVAEPEFPDSYTALRDDQSVGENQTLVRDTMNYKIKKLLDWTNFKAKTLFLYEESESEITEIERLHVKYAMFFETASKKWALNQVKLRNHLDILEQEKSWQEFKIADKYWARKVQFDREVDYHIWMRTGVERPNEMIQWSYNNRAIDQMREKGVSCRHAWLEAKRKWEKLVPGELLAEVKNDIRMDIEDGDKELSMMAMDVGLQVKALGFVPNELTSGIQLDAQGNVVQNYASLHAPNPEPEPNDHGQLLEVGN